MHCELLCGHYLSHYRNASVGTRDNYMSARLYNYYTMDHDNTNY